MWLLERAACTVVSERAPGGCGMFFDLNHNTVPVPGRLRFGAQIVKKVASHKIRSKTVFTAWIPMLADAVFLFSAGLGARTRCAVGRPRS